MEDLRSGSTRNEKQERRDGEDESEHFWKNATHSDYQQRSHGTVALPSGATSFIPTTATGRELGMAACSFCFWRRKIMFRPKTNSRNAWVLQQLIKNVSSLGLHYTALSLFPILYLKKRCDYIRVPKSIGFVMNVL